MGFFSSSKPKPSYTDKVWKASSFCLKGMMTDALKAITEEKDPVVIPHFSESQETIIEFLSSNNVPYFLVETGGSTEALEQSRVVFVSSVKFFQSNESLDFFTKLSTKKPLQLLFLGHYPLPSKENKLLERLVNIKSLATTFYSSLDESSFEIFGADNIISIMEKLGLKDEECIEHTMVTKAMERAREKVESKIKSESEASSEKEWFRKNVKG
jgi:hypothetical protein